MSSYLALDVPDTHRLRAIAEEGAIADADLDELEHRLLHGELDPQQRAALALAIARAGRASSGSTLAAVRAKLAADGFALEASVLSLALELLAVPPSVRVERAESGYRFTDPRDGTSLFVEDPIAAHWHHQDRWGPPIRPDPTAKVIVARGNGEVDRLAEAIDRGEIVLIAFSPRFFQPPSPAVRMVRAGLSRDPRLSIATRWSEVRSVGVMEKGSEKAAAFETAEGRVVFPPRAAIPVEELVALIARVVERARA